MTDFLPYDLSNDARLVTGVVALTAIACLSMESTVRVFSCFTSLNRPIPKLLFFNIFATIWAILATYALVNIPFHKKQWYMAIEGGGLLGMSNSHCWLGYLRLTVLAPKNAKWYHKVVAALQALIIITDLSIFTFVQGDFKAVAAFFFFATVLCEVFMDITLVFGLREFSKNSVNPKVKKYLQEIYMSIFIDLAMAVFVVITDYSVDTLMFIQIKRITYAIKTRLMIGTLSDAKAMLVGNSSSMASSVSSGQADRIKSTNAGNPV